MMCNQILHGYVLTVLAGVHNEQKSITKIHVKCMDQCLTWDECILVENIYVLLLNFDKQQNVI